MVKVEVTEIGFGQRQGKVGGVRLARRGVHLTSTGVSEPDPGDREAVGWNGPLNVGSQE